MELTIRSIDEGQPGPQLAALFGEFWPSYRRWFLREGAEMRPAYLECKRALETHLRPLVPLWERFCERVGGGDLEARFLSLFCPPPHQFGCAQAAWPGPPPALMRNYDYAPRLFEGVLLRSRWHEQTVVAMTDCLIGALDGMNESGLCASLSFGGRREVGEGFGAQLVVRAVLELCRSTAEAAALLAGLRTHMAYTILVVDRAGAHLSAFLRPDAPTVIEARRITTNHQGEIAWRRHARATRTVEREHCLLERAAVPGITRNEFLATFLTPPVHTSHYRRGFGTLYTVVYDPTARTVDLHWPGTDSHQSLDSFQPGKLTVALPPG